VIGQQAFRFGDVTGTDGQGEPYRRLAIPCWQTRAFPGTTKQVT